MAKRGEFEFELYRLNIADTERSLFEQDKPSLSGNDERIIEVLRTAALPYFTSEKLTPRTMYRWDVRQFVDYSAAEIGNSPVVGITLARSMISQAGDIVTDDAIVQGSSAFDPPLALTIDLLFQFERHLVAVERYTPITGTGAWQTALHEILEQAAVHLAYKGRIELEPVPRKEEIMRAFRSFERLTRLRVMLRIPNPELSRYAAQLYTEMQNGGVHEYLNDMRSTKGLSKEDGRLPHAAAEIAQSGYKRGTVTMEGIRGGRRDRAETGGKAARGHTGTLRDYIRGIKDNAKAKETKQAVSLILKEMDRIAPRPDGHESIEDEE